MRKSFKKTLLQMTAIGTALGVMGPIPAFAQIDEIVVTAQKREESIMSVPIAITAFDASALDMKQIDTFSDLQFNVPNVSFSKTNFTGSNFQIRGIGTLLTAASGDSGVGMHVNDVYLNAPKIFETEYYDMEQIEILRGPQGTLFGRNATGGAVNMKTMRPIMDEVSAGGEIQYGNYDHKKAKGFVNLPLVDGKAAARIAAVFLDRDGYTKNLFNGHDIDDREQWSVRGSLRITPNDRTTIDLMAHYFQEDSTRLRGVKQFCDNDPSGVLGCLPTTRENDTVNPFGTAGTLLSSNLVLGGPIPGLGPLALFDIFTDPTGGTSPSNVRHVNAQFDPSYDADEVFVMAEINHELNEDFNLTILAGYQETSTISRQDYSGNIGAPITMPLALDILAPGVGAFFGTGAGGPLPQSDVGIHNNHTSLGAMSGDFELTNNSNARDLSLARANQWNVEARVVSDLDGPLNFQASAFYMDYQGDGNYFVQAVSLEYPAFIFNGFLPGAGFSPDPGSFHILGPSLFDSETDKYGLESWALAGEVYLDIVPDLLKLTGGMRYTTDKKSIRDRGKFLNVLTSVEAATGNMTIVLDPQQRVLEDPTASEFYNLAASLAFPADYTDSYGNPIGGDPLYDADPNIPGGQAFREKSVKFDELTGRVVLDFTPTDDVLFYASYSRGYKGGGINPPIDTNLFPDTVETFEPEIVDAFEIGIKTTMLDNTLQFTGAAFYYDYGGLQIGKIENRTSINENMDAKIKGFELETLWAPDDHFQFNAQLSWLDTKLGEFETVDPRDPNQGRTDVTVVKDFITAAHCVIEHGDLGPPVANAAFMAASGGAFIPTGVDLGGGAMIPATPGIAFSAFSICPEVVQPLAGAFGYNVTSGVTTNLKGNELIASPEWTLNVGAQYTMETGSGYRVTGRVDYYWQDSMWGRVFNRPGIDAIDSWSQINLQLTLTAPDDRWFARGFIQNVADKDNVTGMYSTDPASGLFTNAFLNEPRLLGFTIGAQF